MQCLVGLLISYLWLHGLSSVKVENITFYLCGMVKGSNHNQLFDIGLFKFYFMKMAQTAPIILLHSEHVIYSLLNIFSF